MGFLDRLMGLLKEDEQAPRREDPQRAINRVIRELKKKVTEGGARVSGAVRDAKKMRAEVLKLRAEAKRHHKEAKVRLQRGEEAEARRCLSRRVQAEELAKEMEHEYTRQRDVIKTLRTSLDELAERVRVVEVRREKLRVQTRRARALAARKEAMDGGALDGVEFLLLEASTRMEVEEELLGAGGAGDSLERRFAELEASGEHSLKLLEDLRDSLDEE